MFLILFKSLEYKHLKYLFFWFFHIIIIFFHIETSIVADVSTKGHCTLDCFFSCVPS